MCLRRLTALLMVLAYLVLPLDPVAAHPFPVPAPVEKGLCTDAATPCHTPATQTVCATTCDNSEISALSGSPHCPCSDSHAPGECDANCSCCSCGSCLAPLPGALAFATPPPKVPYPDYDRFQKLPEVYLPIFVPPQNLG